MEKDKVYISMINTNRWRLLRHDKLSQSPLCERCKEEGRLRPASEVHHIVPVENGHTKAERAALMFDPHNLQALCHDCHVTVHNQMGKWKRENVRKRRAEYMQRFKEKFS